MVGCEREGVRAARSQPTRAELAGGNREDLRQGTAPALRLVAAGHRPRVHADRRRPVRGRGRAADPCRGPGAVAVRVLVQPRPAAQVPARLGAGAGRRAARRRAARPRDRGARLVERRHRRHRPAGLAAGPPRLAGVRPARCPAAAHRRPASRSAWTWAAPPSGCRPRARPRWSGAAGWTRPVSRCCRSRCRPPGGAGARSCCTTACRTASGPPPPGHVATPSSTRSSCGRPPRCPPGWCSWRPPPRPTGTPWSGWRPMRVRRRGLVVLGAAAVPDVLGEPDAAATRATASTWTRTTTASPDIPGRWGTARTGSCGCRSASAGSRRPAALVRGLLDGWVADSPDTRDWRDLEEVC